MAGMLWSRAWTHGLALALAGLLAVTWLAVGVGGKPAVASTSEAPPPRPAHVHQGTCEALDPNPAYPLSDLTLPQGSDDHAADHDATIPTALSVTTLDVALADLLAASYVINVHESQEEIADYVACGAIGGEVGPDGLAVGLAPHGPHGDFSGVAWLRPEGSRTIVAVFLTEGIMAARVAPPTPVAEDEPAEVAVTLGGPAGEFAITAAQTTFQVGVPYRFVVTNAGTIPHEFMIIPAMPMGGMDMEGMHHMALGLIDEEELPPGATRTLDVVFTEPAPAGTIELACHVPSHYETGMHLPIEVVS